MTMPITVQQKCEDIDIINGYAFGDMSLLRLNNLEAVNYKSQTVFLRHYFYHI